MIATLRRWCKSTHGTIRHETHPDVKKTHCKQGHALTHGNLVKASLKKGKRDCLACATAHGYLHLYPELVDTIPQVADRYYEAIINDGQRKRQATLETSDAKEASDNGKPQQIAH